MRSGTSSLLRTALALAVSLPLLQAQYGRPKIAEGVGIDQKLNSAVPLDLVFHDEANQLVPLRTYFGDKPVLLEFVYFNCTSLCPMVLMESVMSLKRVALEPGRDYDVVVVSIDPHDTPAVAAEKKADYAHEFASPGFNAGWHFLTGDAATVKRLADAVGFHYRWDEATKQFSHAAGIMIVTPDGKVSRYLFGTQYAPQDLRMGLVEAAKHKIGTPADYILLLCFHYDASQGKYTLAIFKVIRLAGAVTLLALGILIYLLMRKDKKKKARATWKEVRHVS